MIVPLVIHPTLYGEYECKSTDDYDIIREDDGHIPTRAEIRESILDDDRLVAKAKEMVRSMY